MVDEIVAGLSLQEWGDEVKINSGRNGKLRREPRGGGVKEINT